MRDFQVIGGVVSALRKRNNVIKGQTFLVVSSRLSFDGQSTDVAHPIVTLRDSQSIDFLYDERVHLSRSPDLCVLGVHVGICKTVRFVLRTVMLAILIARSRSSRSGDLPIRFAVGSLIGDYRIVSAFAGTFVVLACFLGIIPLPLGRLIDQPLAVPLVVVSLLCFSALAAHTIKSVFRASVLIKVRGKERLLAMTAGFHVSIIPYFDHKVIA